MESICHKINEYPIKNLLFFIFSDLWLHFSSFWMELLFTSFRFPQTLMFILFHLQDMWIATSNTFKKLLSFHFSSSFGFVSLFFFVCMFSNLHWGFALHINFFQRIKKYENKFFFVSLAQSKWILKAFCMRINDWNPLKKY